MRARSLVQSWIANAVERHVVESYREWKASSPVHPMREPELTVTRLLNHCLSVTLCPPALTSSRRRRQWTMVRAAIVSLENAKKIHAAADRVGGQRAGLSATRYRPGEWRDEP